jgi:hypothetical protein
MTSGDASDSDHSTGASIIFRGAVEVIPAHGWRFDQFFKPLEPGPFAAQVQEVSRISDNSGVERHPFFAFAGTQRRALEVWAEQEAVTTNAFSQMLLICCSHIKNVHARTAFMPVIGGEHHGLTHRTADKSHPWLLKTLCESLGIDTLSIEPAACTVGFLRTLCDAVSDPFCGLAALGVGNERMLIPEYTAVRTAFDRAAPNAAYASFLNSNIAEDVSHSTILQDISACLIQTDEEFSRYREGAVKGVTARMTYYDQLLELVRSSG